MPVVIGFFEFMMAMRIGIPTKKIHEITKIDYWFLHQMEEIIVFEREIQKYTVDNLPKDLLLEAKIKGFADRQIGSFG